MVLLSINGIICPMPKYPNCHIHSENSIIIYFSKAIKEENLTWIANTHQTIKKKLGTHYLDGVACYQNLTIFYDLNNLNSNQAMAQIQNAINNHHKPQKNNAKHIRIPVFYDESIGFDLLTVLQHKQLSKTALIQLHTEQSYRVYGVGFLPNFAYLGILNKNLYSPRLNTPRSTIPAGSVGIANDQTGVYPIASSAGWQIIGTTPLDLSINGNIIFCIGDYIEFYAINQKTYEKSL